MRHRSIELRQEMRQAISEEIADRTREHQVRVAASIETARIRAIENSGSALESPLLTLAQGDSWFDYPLTGNDLPMGNTDVISQLSKMGAVHPHILNLAHFGEASGDELSLSKQKRMIAALADANNWMPRGQPDAILFSRRQ